MHLCFATSTNRRWRHDGDYFVAEMSRYRRVHGSGLVIATEIPTKGKNHAKLRKDVNQVTKEWIKQYPYKMIKRFAFFMHGTSKWLLGAGHNVWTIENWVKLLPKTKEKIYITLYSCSNGNWIDRSAPGKIGKKYDGDWVMQEQPMRGEYGFAMRLGYALLLRGFNFQIYAHTTKGDTTRNPKAVWITSDITSLGDSFVKKEWVVKPVSWWQGRKDAEGRKRWLTWIDLLQAHPAFRYQVPYMDREELDKRLDQEISKKSLDISQD